jgi:hypothetical protein
MVVANTPIRRKEAARMRHSSQERFRPTRTVRGLAGPSGRIVSPRQPISSIGRGVAQWRCRPGIFGLISLAIRTLQQVRRLAARVSGNSAGGAGIRGLDAPTARLSLGTRPPNQHGLAVRAVHSLSRSSSFTSDSHSPVQFATSCTLTASEVDTQRSPTHSPGTDTASYLP